MSRSGRYHDLAGFFAYPWQKEPLESAVTRFAAREGALPEAFAEFRRYVAASSLAALQEEYVAAFDMNPPCAPYLGHHLYGEHRLRAEYLVRLQALYREMGYRAPQGEPADHLPSVFGFLASLGEEAPGERRSFLSEFVLDGVRRLATAVEARENFPWRGAVAAAVAICAADCEEV